MSPRDGVRQSGPPCNAPARAPADHRQDDVCMTMSSERFNVDQSSNKSALLGTDKMNCNGIFYSTLRSQAD